MQGFLGREREKVAILGRESHESVGDGKVAAVGSASASAATVDSTGTGAGSSSASLPSIVANGEDSVSDVGTVDIHSSDVDSDPDIDGGDDEDSDDELLRFGRKYGKRYDRERRVEKMQKGRLSPHWYVRCFWYV